MSTVYSLIIACGVLALLYGIYTIRSVLAYPTGTDKMHEIASAIQEGANAYLNRQYTAIAIAGVVIGVILGFLLGLTEKILSDNSISSVFFPSILIACIFIFSEQLESR